MAQSYGRDKEESNWNCGAREHFLTLNIETSPAPAGSGYLTQDSDFSGCSISVEECS